MAHEYTDPTRIALASAMPDVEIFPGSDYAGHGMYAGYDLEWYISSGFYYAYGSVGCLWDSDPIGPYASYDEALSAARTN